MVLLAVLKLNYWCKDEKEKQAFLNELDENEREYNEKYNPDNLFNNQKNNYSKVTETSNKENILPIKYKDKNIILRFLEKITKFFKRSK